MNRKQLAAQLGISASMVSRLANKMGMPTDSVERARRWREKYLRVRMPDQAFVVPAAPVAAVDQARACAKRAAAAPLPAPVRADAKGAALLAAAIQLGLAAQEALGTPAQHQLLELVRGAMKQVPQSLRDQVALTEQVWDALTEASVPLSGGDDHGSAIADSESVPDEVMGRFWYAAAQLPPGTSVERIIQEMENEQRE